MQNLTQLLMQQWGRADVRQVFNRNSLLLTSSAMLAMLLVGCTDDPSSSEVQTISIGFLNPETGPIVVYAPGFETAAKIALAQANVLYGEYIQFELIKADSGCDGTEAASGAQTLVDAGVVGVVGAACSGASMGANAVLSAAGIPMISYASTNPRLSDASAYPDFFRVVPSDALEGHALADVMTADGQENIAVLHMTNAYGSGTADAFVKRIESINSDFICENKDGVQLIIGYDNDTTDFSSDVNDITAAECDSVMMVSYNKDGAALIEELKDEGFTGAIYGADGIADVGLASYMSDDDQSVVDGIIATKPATEDDMSDLGKTFSELCSQRSECADGSIYTAEVFDAVSIMAHASAQQLLTTEVELSELIMGVGQLYQGASGEITFTENGDVGGSGYCVGEFAYDDTTGAVSFTCARDWDLNLDDLDGVGIIT